jgi:FlaA1/EpsC-like NDP-sugar epimerase
MQTFIILVLSIRLIAIYIIGYIINAESMRSPIAIFGAGQAGVQLILALKQSTEYRPVALVDDNRSLDGLVVEGLRVSSPDALSGYVKEKVINEIFLAIPSLTSPRRRQVLASLGELDCKIRELPSINDVIKSGNVLGSLRQVSVDEVLGRDSIDLKKKQVKAITEGKTVLVSGAGGSIGSEICRQLLANRVGRIILLELSEFALYCIEAELTRHPNYSKDQIVPCLGNVIDSTLVNDLINKFDVNSIYHAAAYKHVPLVEFNEVEGARNNVLGTKILAEAAVKNGVERFTLISTDKAVNPTNVMGATKRLAEHVIQYLQSEHDKTVFSIVRFGNVLGSSGSVVPLFKEQIARGGPVTLTHRDVTRYFMTIPEASSLVLLASASAEGGEVFVLDMGEPIKIHDLATRLIELSGFKVKDADNPNGDIEIAVTGLRSGEKLFEELLIEPGTLPTDNPQIFRAKEADLSKDNMLELIDCIEKAVIKRDPHVVRECIKKWVEGYHRAEDI